jgi:N-acyl-D-aspartate/D-glutamate deacylase
VVIDPAFLDERLDGYHEAPVPQYAGLPRMVNRNDAAVNLVLIGGRTVVADGVPTAVLGSERTGSFLRAGRPTPAPTTTKEGLAHVG